MSAYAAARTLADIDWENWTPVDRATLVFVIRDGEILLIHKKRGLGAGKINGPGGRLDPGETPLECADREVREEILVQPIGLEPAGILNFQFLDGYSIYVSVFRAHDCEGEPGETEEAVPVWFPVDQLPFDRMWADDRIWLPLLLARQGFEGRFLFDGDALLDHSVELRP